MFYERFISLCEFHEKSPKEVLRELGVKKNINYKLHKWETGTIPRDSTINKIAEYFNVSLSYFYFCKFSENIFGNQVKLHRRLSNMKQSELANRISVTQATLSEYESGKATPSFEIVIKIADTLSCTIDELVQRNQGRRSTNDDNS
ncbi:MAG: helix-turn-helix domain-containing protein [Eubacterium sp.]|nr:helix-turn-helix domain-containing protein [Eubacterium sp.]